MKKHEMNALIVELASQDVHVSSTDIDMLFMHFDTDRSGVIERSAVMRELQQLHSRSKPKPPASHFTDRVAKGKPRHRSNDYLFAKPQFSPRAPPGMSDASMAW